MTQHSFGLLVYRWVDDGFEVLIGHMGGPYWTHKHERAWSIPKGGAQSFEDPLTAARREFEEELGFEAPSGDLIDLGAITQRNGKVVFAWGVEGDPDLDAFEPGQFTMMWPPRSGRRQNFPEIDQVMWATPDEARILLVAVQSTFLDRLGDSLAD